MLAVGAIAGWLAAAPDTLNWQPQLAFAQPWRWFSAAWVHLSAWHLGANLAGLALVALLGLRAGATRVDTLAWLVAWPLTHLALLAQPSLARYAGLSGVLHAGVVIVALRLVGSRVRGRHLLGLAILAGVVLKLLLEQPWRGPLRVSSLWDFAVAPAAHLSGACAGALCGWVALRVRRRAGASS